MVSLSITTFGRSISLPLAVREESLGQKAQCHTQIGQDVVSGAQKGRLGQVLHRKPALRSQKGQVKLR